MQQRSDRSLKGKPGRDAFGGRNSLWPACAVALVTSVFGARGEDWPQWRGPGRDGVWSTTGFVGEPQARLVRTHWRKPVGFGFASPVVADGKVFLPELQLDRVASHERVVCYDETTGRTLWSQAYEVKPPEWAFNPGQETGPNATPIVEGGRLFAIGWHGHLHCLETGRGDVVWRRDLAHDYPDAELRTTASPLVEGRLLILVIGGKPDACVVALDKETGQEVWRALREGAGYSSPVITRVEGTRQLLVWTIESVTSLDPASGKRFWRIPIATPADMVVSTPVCRDDRLLVGGMMFRLVGDPPSATLLWPEQSRPTARVLSVTSTAFLTAGHLYSPRLNGELICLEADTGREVWRTNSVTDLKSGASIHITQTGNSALLFTDRGELIQARLSPAGYQEITRATLVAPVTPFGGRNVAWSPPAFANGCAFVRTSKELVCASLALHP